MNRLIIMALVFAGCATPDAGRDRPAEDLIGRPPPPSEDPFYFVAMEKAVRVDTSGRVEPDPVEPDQVELDQVEPGPVDPKSERASDPQGNTDLALRESRLESREQDLRVREAELSRREAEVESRFAELARKEFELEKENESIRRDLLARESGVVSAKEEVEALRRQIEASRPIVSENAPEKPKPSGFQCMSCVSVCPVVDGRAVCQGDDDVVCGWGVNDAKDLASRVAVAECRGALDLMESGKQYREIQGNCPPATCSP